jgi:thiol peroxidase
MSAQDTIERAGGTNFQGKPMTLVGPQIAAGDKAPDFQLATKDLSTATLETVLDGGKRAALLIVVPSLDTSVCQLESRKFNKRIRELPDGVKGYVVSVDLPFAMARWSGAEEDDVELEMLSDYRSHDFGKNYGVYIKELALLARATFVIDKEGIVRYAEIVPEIASEPNYDEALAAAKSAV